MVSLAHKSVPVQRVLAADTYPLPPLFFSRTGLHSTCRQIVLGRSSLPIPTGQMAYRVTLPASRLKGIESLDDLITTPGNVHWIGPRGTILSYLLQGINDTLINLVFTYAFPPLVADPGKRAWLLILFAAVTSNSALWKMVSTKKAERPRRFSGHSKAGIQGTSLASFCVSYGPRSVATLNAPLGLKPSSSRWTRCWSGDSTPTRLLTTGPIPLGVSAS